MKRGNLGSHRRLREWLSTRGHHRTRNRSWKKPGFKENPSPLTFVFCAALSPHQGDTRSPPPSSCHLVQPLKTPQFLTCPISVTIPVSLHWFLSCPGFAATFLCPQGKGSGRDIVTWDDGKVPPHPSGLELYKNHPPCRPCFGEIQGENTPNKEQTKKKSPHQEHPCPPSVFQAFSVCKSQFIQVPAAFWWAALPRASEVVWLQQVPKQQLQVNPGKLGYGEIQIGWSQITPQTSQQHLCCSKCLLHH